MYSSLTNLKIKLGKEFEETEDDSRLNSAISAAADYIDAYCGRDWRGLFTGERSFSLAYSSPYLIIDDCTNITKVTQVYYTEETEVEQYMSYPLPPKHHTRLESNRFAYPPYYYKVDATYGYEEVPAAIVEASDIIVMKTWKRPDAIYGVAGASNFAPITTMSAFADDGTVSDLLAPFRRFDR